MSQLTPNQYQRNLESKMEKLNLDGELYFAMFNFYMRHHPSSNELGKADSIKKARAWIKRVKLHRDGRL